MASVLKFQILSHTNQNTIALGRILAGKIAPLQLWMVEQRPVGPAWRSRSVSGIAYLAKNGSGDPNRNNVQCMPGGSCVTIKIELPANWDALMAQLGYRLFKEFFLK